MHRHFKPQALDNLQHLAHLDSRLAVFQIGNKTHSHPAEGGKLGLRRSLGFARLAYKVT